MHAWHADFDPGSCCAHLQYKSKPCPQPSSSCVQHSTLLCAYYRKPLPVASRRLPTTAQLPRIRKSCLLRMTHRSGRMTFCRSRPPPTSSCHRRASGVLFGFVISSLSAIVPSTPIVMKNTSMNPRIFIQDGIVSCWGCHPLFDDRSCQTDENVLAGEWYFCEKNSKHDV